MFPAEYKGEAGGRGNLIQGVNIITRCYKSAPWAPIQEFPVASSGRFHESPVPSGIAEIVIPTRNVENHKDLPQEQRLAREHPNLPAQFSFYLTGRGASDHEPGSRLRGNQPFCAGVPWVLSNPVRDTSK